MTKKLRAAAFGHRVPHFYSTDFEIHIDPKSFERTLFPFLNKIKTQDALISGIETLTQCESPAAPSEGNDGKQWTDMNKFVPYLAVGEYENAAKNRSLLIGAVPAA